MSDWLHIKHKRVGWLLADGGGSAGAAPSGGGSSASSAANTAGLIGAGVSALTGIATTIANISDQNKRREFQQQIDLLTNQQQQQLNLKLLVANTQTERLNILSQSIVQFATANQNAASKTKTILLVSAGLLTMGLLITVVILTKRKS